MEQVPKFAVGLDVVIISRMERAMKQWGTRFLDRVFTPAEQEACKGNPASLAARFAGKEAVLKALGTGWAHGIRWRDVEILTGTKGEPYILLHGKAAWHASRLGIRDWRISLTHDGNIAAAVVIGVG